MGSESAPSPLMSTAYNVIARTQDMKPATALMTGAVDTAGPLITATMNALPLTSPVAPLRASFPLPIVTWAPSVPPLWSEEMTPMRCALLLEIMMETWKALPQTDRWNCQPRREVMLRSACLPLLFFRTIPLPFPSIFLYCFTSSLTKPLGLRPSPFNHL